MHLHQEMHTQAYNYALDWAQHHVGLVQALEFLPCVSTLFRSGDCAWIAQPTLVQSGETEPFLVAWRQGQFAATMINDFVLSMAGHLEASWRERGYADVAVVCDWHPPLEDFTHAELATADEQDDAWVIEVAFSAQDVSQLSTAFSIIWFHYGKTIDIRVIDTHTIPFSTDTTAYEGE